MPTIRRPAVAGMFYPADKPSLESAVRILLSTSRPTTFPQRPKALIVPHAGYIYSGETAAAAYASLAPYAREISRVILLGPAHRVPLHGLALPGVDAFATPLGIITLDAQAIALLANLKQLSVNAAAHAAEHSLEVQLPFLQSVLGPFTLVPLTVGDARAEDIAESLEMLWGGPETLIVISSDLSHFLSYEDAQVIDRDTTDQILAMTSLDSYQQACGALPINGFMLSAKRHHLHPQLIAQCNSGDTAGDKKRVVGYASFAFLEEDGHD